MYYNIVYNTGMYICIFISACCLPWWNITRW